MKWVYIKGMIQDNVLKQEPRFIKAVNGECDLREVLAKSDFYNGKIQTDYFTVEYRFFVESVYGLRCSGPYPGQVDNSEYNKKIGDYEILIGDCGVINFFINSRDLEKRNFNDVLYNWDCC